ncbi:MAG: hypothetical protein H8F28_07805 [Fibrella sp.]|nr:hypothetical protein [Armatimonadota bacterium]
MNRRLILAFGVLSFAVFNTTSAYAVDLVVANAGFENPSLAVNVFTTGGIVGWTNSPGGDFGSWRPNNPNFFTTPVPEGVQVGYINGISIAQGLTDTLQAGSYDLSLQIGRRVDGFVGDTTVQLFAGGNVANGVVTGGTLLSSASLSFASIVVGTFQPLTLNYVVANNDPSLGQNLSIRIVKTSGTQIDFDAVRLQSNAVTVVPESPTGLLAVVGLVVFVIGKRRKGQ